MTTRHSEACEHPSPATLQRPPRARDDFDRRARPPERRIAARLAPALRLVALPVALTLTVAMTLGCGESGETSADAAADVRQNGEPLPRYGGIDASKPAIRARARVRPTEGHSATGTIEFAWTGGVEPDGTRVVAELRNLPAGAHAFHVHEFGDCSAADASSAGDHFAFRVTEAPADRIVGNLGELRAGPDGRARLERVVAHARLAGPRSLIGQSVVVHAKGNDPADAPGGGAGGRIACGVIEAVE